MKTIKFSEEYEKMKDNRYNDIPIMADLLEVFKMKSEDLNKEFIEYDTIYFNKKENKWNYYKLPTGEVIILLLKTHFLDEDMIWTTIRRFTPSKFEYYKKARGETFVIKISI
jgi:hypothetical protein